MHSRVQQGRFFILVVGDATWLWLVAGSFKTAQVDRSKL
jgi:hypothetical protein